MALTSRLNRTGNGRLWSRELALWLGLWQGRRSGLEATWLRLYDSDGRLIPTAEEAERQRADAAEAEIARLRALLGGRQ